MQQVEALKMSFEQLQISKEEELKIRKRKIEKG